MKRKCFSFLILWIIFGATLRAEAFVSFSVSGNWMKTINSSELIFGPEIILPSTYTSSSNAVTMNINANGNESWMVHVSKNNSIWDPRLRLYIRRTGNGSGTGTISGGTSFQEITSLNQTFFSGRKKYSNIPVQFQLTGVSLYIPPSSNITTITYTITEQ